jgi:hypothetical protein
VQTVQHTLYVHLPVSTKRSSALNVSNMASGRRELARGHRRGHTHDWSEPENTDAGAEQRGEDPETWGTVRTVVSCNAVRLPEGVVIVATPAGSFCRKYYDGRHVRKRATTIF